MKIRIWLLILPLAFAGGGCAETGGGGLYVLSVEDGVELFKNALAAGDPNPIIGMAADEIVIGEPYSCNCVKITKNEFAEYLNNTELMDTKSFFSKERVSSFVNEHNMGTLVIEDTMSNSKVPEPDGGKSVSTEAQDWYLEFHPTGNDVGNQWELTVCTVRHLSSDG